MKSEKAKKMIENGKHVLSIADKVFIHSQEGVDKDVAESAVEIAEAEMRERAIEAYRHTCPFNINGYCSDGSGACGPLEENACFRYHQFVKYLNEQEKP